LKRQHLWIPSVKDKYNESNNSMLKKLISRVYVII
jgi:hypothetical protein